jgi:hypothetical protein
MTAFGDRLWAKLPPAAAPVAVAEATRPQAAPATPEQCQAAEQLYAEAEAAAERLIRDVFRPLLVEFQAVMEASGVLCPGKYAEDRVPRGPYWCSYQATGSANQGRGEASKRRDYYIRISAAAYHGGTLELSVECCHGATRACRFSRPRTHFVKFDPPSISAAEFDHEFAQQWCADLLEQCAAAFRNANLAAAGTETDSKSEEPNLKAVSF